MLDACLFVMVVGHPRAQRLGDGSKLGSYLTPSSGMRAHLRGARYSSTGPSIGRFSVGSRAQR